MSWRHAFEPWEPYDHTDAVSNFIRSFGFDTDLDEGDDCCWITCVFDANGDTLYDRDNDDSWEEIDCYLPDSLIARLDAVQNWNDSGSIKSKKLKTFVGSMAKLPLP